MYRQYDVVAVVLDGGHIRCHHITGGRLGYIFRQFSGVGLQALPFAGVGVDAYIADLAAVVDTCAGVADCPARWKLDTEPASLAAKF
ncbi:hypothetical protein SAMN05216516_103277 [Izhakiella capsodis]|uniref:Uncharacterized protein n=1 Tax=Izhakiella capsodis TaxID=1367852 RepID=A0A1I4X3I8_9GAMM|nr:hypothetical protein SAMN05216516_103277 [Izhakiella capsodis]